MNFVYLGGFVSSRIAKERGLPSLNTAGVNRMRRLGDAVKQAGAQVLIVAPGSSFGMRTASSGRYLHSAVVEHSGGIPVVYCAAVGIRGIGALCEPFLVARQLQALHVRRPIGALMVYCFYPSSLAAALLARLWIRCPLVLNLEDISIPSWSDWRSDSETRPVQQAVGWLAMQAILRLSNAVVVPSRRFLDVIRWRKPAAVVRGCMEAFERHSRMSTNDETLRILFAGRLEREHGIDLLVSSLQLLDTAAASRRIEVNICGTGHRREYVSAELGKLKHVRVTMHGFVSDSEYARILGNSHVALALQDPFGRHCRYKSPSKAYEFMAMGAATIVSDVGDFAELPDEIRVLLDPYDPRVLANAILSFSPESADAMGERASRYAGVHWSPKTNGQRILDLLRNK